MDKLCDDILLKIIFHLYTGSAEDPSTLCDFSRVCISINGLMHNKYSEIMNYYIVTLTISPYRYMCTYGRNFHNINDLPADVNINMSQWYQHGKMHRDGDKPAIICTDGAVYYYKNNHLHRDNDQPAVIQANGMREWWYKGKRHRDRGAAIENGRGQGILWYYNGILTMS
jgi:hypothetical protein